MRFIDREEVARRLTYPAAIRIVREAMISLSRVRRRAAAAFRRPSDSLLTPS